MTPKVKSFEKCLSGFCDWTPNYVSWPNLVKIGRCEVAERTSGIWIRPTTQKVGLRGIRPSPHFAQNGLIAPKFPWTLSPLDMSTYTEFGPDLNYVIFIRQVDWVVCGDCNENKHFFSVRWYISANIIPARSRDYRFINPESRDWEKGSGIGISTLRLVKRRLAPRPSRIPDREFAGNGAVSIPSREF